MSLLGLVIRPIVHILSLGILQELFLVILLFSRRLRRLLICWTIDGDILLLRMEKLIAIHILLLLILGLIRRLLFLDRLLHLKTCIGGAIEDRGGLCALYFININASRDGVISMFTVI